MNFVKNLNCVAKHQNDMKLLSGFVKRPFTSGLGCYVESHQPILSTVTKDKSSLGASRFGGLSNKTPGSYFGLKCHSSMSGSSTETVIQEDAQDSSRKKLEKLTNTRTLMEMEVTRFFKERLEYRIYTKDVILENYFNPNKPVIVKGIFNYALSVMKARFYINFWYPRILMSVTKSHVNEENNSVIIHWKIEALRQSTLLQIRNIFPKGSHEEARKLSDHILGISTFHLNDKGFVDKHTLRRVSGPLKESHASDCSTNC